MAAQHRMNTSALSRRRRSQPSGRAVLYQPRRHQDVGGGGPHRALREETNVTHPPLPSVTVIAPREDQVRRSEWTEATVRWVLSNPVYAGVGPVTGRYISSQQWIDGAAKLVAEDGAAQFLVNMIHTLRQTFGTVAPDRPPADSLASVPPDAACDPTLVGIGDTPARVTEAAWIHNAVALIERQGAPYFFRRALLALRAKLGGLAE